MRAQGHGGEGGGGDSSDHGGGGEAVDQRGVVEERGGVDLSVDNSGGLDHRFDHRGVSYSGSRGKVKTRPDDWIDIMTVVPAICFGYQVRDKT